MARFVIDLPINQPKEFVDFIVQDFCTKEGFEFTDYKGERVWKKGIGMLTAPQFLKVAYQNGTVHLEAWLKYAILPGVYCGEMGLTGFFGIAVKKMFKSRIDALIALLQQPVNGAGAPPAAETAETTQTAGDAPTNPQPASAGPIPVRVHDTSGRAVAALVTGILAIVFSFFWQLIGLILGIVGIVLGMQGRKSTKRSMGTAGMVCGIIGVILSAVLFIVSIIIAALAVMAL